MQTCWTLGSADLIFLMDELIFFADEDLSMDLLVSEEFTLVRVIWVNKVPFLKSVSSHWCYLLPGGSSGRKRCHSPHSSGSSSKHSRWRGIQKSQKSSLHVIFSQSDLNFIQKDQHPSSYASSLSRTYYPDLWRREDHSNPVWKYLHKILQGFQGSSELQKHPP